MGEAGQANKNSGSILNNDGMKYIEITVCEVSSKGEGGEVKATGNNRRVEYED